MLSGFAVYVLVAACSAVGVLPSGSGGAGGQATVFQSASAVGAGGVSGASGAAEASSGMVGAEGATVATAASGQDPDPDDGGILDAMFDAIVDPVPDASAGGDGSGSRLKVKYLAGEDGSGLIVGMFDSQLQTDCYFYPAGDGVTRCLPVTQATLVYADAACTKQIGLMWAYAGCAITAPKYTAEAKGVVCGTSSQLSIRPVVSELSPQPSVYYNKTSSGSCASQSLSPTIVYKFFDLGAELPPSSFVGASLQIQP